MEYGGNYSSPKFMHWFVNMYSNRGIHNFDDDDILQILYIIVHHTLNGNTKLSWKDEWKETKAINSVSVFMNELMNYGHKCDDILESIAEDYSDGYIKYQIITIEGILRVCKNIDYARLENLFASVGNMIAVEWLRNRNDV